MTGAVSITSSSNLSWGGVAAMDRAQRLIVMVRDGGSPPLSASATLLVDLGGVSRLRPLTLATSTFLPYPSDNRKEGHVDKTDDARDVSGESFDDSSVVIAVMALAGCLVVIVAFTLVAILIRKSSAFNNTSGKIATSTSRTAIVWSKLDTASTTQEATTGTDLNRTYAPPVASVENAGHLNGGADLVHSKNVKELSVAGDTSDIIMTLDSEPVSYTVGQNC